MHATRLLPLGFLLASMAAAQTPITGPLRDGAGGPLLSGTVYHVTGGGISVASGQTLTIQAGAILKFSGTGFQIDGTLDVNGTLGSPVIFTSIHDDAAGGDTNGNGNASLPGPDQWRGLAFTASASASTLDVAVVRYTGAGFAPCISVDAASPAFRDCSLATGNWGGLALNSAARPTVLRCSFSDIRSHPAIFGADIDAVPGFSNCTVTGNSGGNYLRIDDPVVDGATSIVAANCVGGALTYNTHLTVSLGSTLTLGPGVVMKPTAGYGVYVNGTLLAQGTAGNPVVFTSIHDDTAGGDTNGNANASAPGPDQWRGLELASSAGASVLDRLEVRCTGSGFAPAIALNGAHATLRDCAFGIANWGGLRLDSAARPTVTRCRFAQINSHPAIFGVDIDAVPGFTDCVMAGNSGGNYLRIDDPVVNGSTSIVAANCPGGALVYNTTFIISAGSTLTLGPDVVMKPTAGYGVYVDGNLQVQGTEGHPVVFTSIHDDTAGGDTNSNGNASAPGPDQWRGIQCNATSDASVLSYSSVRYTGAGFSPGLALEDADVVVRNLRILTANWGGLRLSNAARPTVERCTFQDVRSHPALFGGSLEAVPGLRDNVAIGCPGGNYIRVDDPTCDQAVTIESQNCMNGALVYNTTLTVLPAGILRLFPGVVLKPTAGYGINIDGQLYVSGPVTFTSIHDDERGGDTNGNGNASAPGPDQWRGVQMNATARGVIDQLLVRYTGAGFSPAITCASSNVALARTRVEHGNWGGFALSAAAAAQDLVAWDNGNFGIRLDGGGFPLVRSTVAMNRSYGIDRAAAWTGIVVSTISYGNANTSFRGFTAGQIRYSNGPGIAGGTGNLNVDPLFFVPAQGDLRISPYSACVDAGDPADTTGGLDANGFPRNLDGNLDTGVRVDMGAYEHDNVLFAIFGDPSPGQTVTLFSAALPPIHSAVLIVGIGAPFEVPLLNFGPLFPNLFGANVILPWAPNLSVPIQIPLETFTPVLLVVQSVGFAGSFDRGNTSNPSFLVID